jgi:hypothetical protein
LDREEANEQARVRDPYASIHPWRLVSCFVFLLGLTSWVDLVQERINRPEEIERAAAGMLHRAEGEETEKAGEMRRDGKRRRSD